MVGIVWTPNARNDLLRVRDFLAAHSSEAASKAVRTIRSGIDTLKQAPEADRAIDWLPAGYREWIIPFGKGAYVVLYRTHENRIVIQALRHGRESGYSGG